MKRSFHANVIVLLFILSQCCSALVKDSVAYLDGGTATISLASYNKSDSNGQAFSQLTSIAPNSNLTIVVTNIPPVVSFLIVQIHTYQYNVTLSYDTSFLPSRIVFGTNLGLFIVADAKTLTQVKVRNVNINDVEALLAVVAYTENVPIPGGCNMEFDVEVAPFQKLAVNEATVIVDVQPAAIPATKGMKPPCTHHPVQHDMYRLFLPEQDFTTETYFSAIRDMLTVEGITMYSKQMPGPGIGSQMRRVYSAYPGTGSVYATVATFGNHSSAYVPTFTYACSPLLWTDTCQVLTSTFSKVLCAVVLFLGVFTTFLGHKYFKTEMFLLGFLSGGLVSYIVVAIIGNTGPTGNIGIAVALGSLLGVVWLALWWFYAIPVLSILLATLTLGFFWACILYFSVPAGLPYLENDINFWMSFALVILTIPMALSVVPLSANIICCAILGSYAVVIPIDHYIGSNLKYIVINAIRRATSSGFNLAIVQPPYQLKDVSLTLFWVLLATLGIYVQLRQNRGKPPFPPAAASPARRNLQNERTPLLISSRIPIVTVDGDDDVFYSPNHKWFNIFHKMKLCRGTTENT